VAISIESVRKHSLAAKDDATNKVVWRFALPVGGDERLMARNRFDIDNDTNGNARHMARGSITAPPTDLSERE
jgi:hypothetical protein